MSYRKEEIEPEDIPTLLAMAVIAAICIYGLLRFWNA